MQPIRTPLNTELGLPCTDPSLAVASAAFNRGGIIAHAATVTALPRKARLVVTSLPMILVFIVLAFGRNEIASSSRSQRDLLMPSCFVAFGSKAQCHRLLGRSNTNPLNTWSCRCRKSVQAPQRRRRPEPRLSLALGLSLEPEGNGVSLAANGHQGARSDA